MLLDCFLPAKQIFDYKQYIFKRGMISTSVNTCTQI